MDDQGPSSRRSSADDIDQADANFAEEMGYELILNERKMKKNDGSGSGDYHDPHDDDDDADTLWDNDDTNNFIDPHERNEFERRHNPDADRRRSPSLPPSPSMRDSPRPAPQPTFRPPPPPPPPQPYFPEDKEKKRKYLEGLDKFRRRGMNVKHFDSTAPLEEIEMEYNRHKRAVDVEASIQFSRKMLMACVTGLEYLNARFDPLGLALDGWSESVIEDIHNYDDVFERLYDKYHTSVQMAPEFELLLMVAGSAFMFHLTNSMFRSAMPGMGGNPEMMKNVRRGMMGAMSGAFSGAANGGGMSGMFNGMMGGMAPQPPHPKAPGPGGPPPQSRPPPPRRPSGPRPEMRGPSHNMDDLLNNLMEREPNEISDRLVEEIDDILNNPPSDDDEPADAIQFSESRPSIDI